MHNLASAYRSAGRLEEALLLYEKTLELRRSRLGENHPDALKTSRGFAIALIQAGRRDDGLKRQEDTLRRERDRLPTNDSRLGDILIEISKALVAAKEFAIAEAYLREAISVFDVADTDGWRRAQAESMLGAALAGQQKYTEAKPLLIQGYEGMKQHEESIPRPVPKDLQAAAQRLVDFYTATDKPDERQMAGRTGPRERQGRGP